MESMTWLRAQWDRVAGSGLIALGAVALLLGYLGVRNTEFVAEQIAYVVSGGLGGLFLLGLGSTLLLAADVRDEWRKIDSLEQFLRTVAIPVADHVDLADGRADDGGGDSAVPGPSALRQPARAEQPAGRLLQMSETTGAALCLPRPHLALSAVGVTAIALAASAINAAGQDDARAAIGAASIATVALVVGLGGCGLFLFRCLQDAGSRRSALLAPFHRLRAAGNADNTVAGSSGMVKVAPGQIRFHRPGCPTLVGTRAENLRRDEVPAALLPCGLCRPS